MYSAYEIYMLRTVAKGSILPGIDTSVGNNVALSTLKGLSSIPTTRSNHAYPVNAHTHYI